MGLLPLHAVDTDTPHCRSKIIVNLHHIQIISNIYIYMITRRKLSPSDLVLWVATLTSILLAKASMRRHSACKSVDASATVWTSFGFVHCRICQDSIKPNQTLNSKLSNCPMFNVSLTQVQVFSDDLWGTDIGQTRQKRFATSPYHKPSQTTIPKTSRLWAQSPRLHAVSQVQTAKQTRSVPLPPKLTEPTCNFENTASWSRVPQWLTSSGPA